MRSEDDPIFTGAVPWTTEDYLATVEEARRLRSTPHDDWDRAPRGFRVRKPDGSVERWTANPDILTYQLTGFLLRRHADHPENVPYHMFRFHVINEFFVAHAATLVRDGLATEVEDGGFRIRSEVLDVVTQARYEDLRIDEFGHEQCTFNYLEVLPAARELIAAGDSGDSAESPSNES